MRHPTEGVLRRLLDEPAGVADADRQHVAGCPQCLDELAAVREDAALVDAALTTEAAQDVDVDAAWRRLSTAAPATPAPARPAQPRASRSRAVLRRPIVAAARRRASSWPARAPLRPTTGCRSSGPSRSPRSASRRPTSSRCPTSARTASSQVTGDPDVHEVADAAAAAGRDRVSTCRRSPTLPRGVSGEPVYQVGGKVSATFTFSAERAAQAAAEAGETLPPPPPGLDGSSVRLDAGPGVAQIWSSSAGAPALVVGRAVAPTAFSSGVPFETVRDYLLSLPGLPDDVAAQLRTFTADGATLPLPGARRRGDDVVGGGGRRARHGAGDPRPDAGGRRLGGRRRGDRRGWFAGRRRGPVGRQGPAVSVADTAHAVGDAAARRAAADLVAGLPSAPAVWCSGLRKRYGRQQAVEDVSLEVGRGEIVGLLGPNGAGKTSVIKMLLGLVHPDEGEVMLLGQPGADPAARARVGYLPELFRYQPWLSAAEVLALHVRLSGIDVTARGAAGLPGPRRPGRTRRRPAGRLLEGDAAAPRAGGRPGGRAGAGRPGRADQRAGPARARRRARHRAGAEGARRRGAARTRT